jgi:hypothetical protein
LSYNLNQPTETVPELLVLGPERLDVLHQRDLLPGKRIHLLTHGVGSSHLQRGQECPVCVLSRHHSGP